MTESAQNLGLAATAAGQPPSGTLFHLPPALLEVGVPQNTSAAPATGAPPASGGPTSAPTAAVSQASLPAAPAGILGQGSQPKPADVRAVEPLPATAALPTDGGDPKVALGQHFRELHEPASTAAAAGVKPPPPSQAAPSESMASPVTALANVQPVAFPHLPAAPLKPATALALEGIARAGSKGPAKPIDRGGPSPKLEGSSASGGPNETAASGAGAAAILTRPLPGVSGDAPSAGVAVPPPTPDLPASTASAAGAPAEPVPESDLSEASPAAFGGPTINMARVVDTVRGSEMRVGLHTEEFGNISVSTAVNRQQIAAQISFDHGDLGKLMAAHLPAMQEKLGGDTGLHATVEVQSRGSSLSGGQSGTDSGQPGQPGDQGHAKQTSRSYGSEAIEPGRSALSASEARAPTTAARSPTSAARRLDILI